LSPGSRYRGIVTSLVPVIVCIDVEPDRRDPDRSDPSPWSGFEALHPWLERRRPRLAALTGSPARFSWYFRMDPQVAETYGSPTWAVTRYRRQVDEVRGQGDELGVHPHPFRWDSEAGSWIVDHGSQPWIDHCVRTALAAFREALGSTCRVFRFGDHWMNDATEGLLEELGVRFDLTLEPGTRGMPGLVFAERRTGSIPDLTDAPRHPYRPSRHDFRTPDPSRTEGLWMIPVTTGQLPPGLRRARALYRWITRAGDVSLDALALNLALTPVLFRAVAAPVLTPPGPSCLVVVLHSRTGKKPRAMANLGENVGYLLAHPLRDRFVFCTPAEALRLLDLA
jgi:hypothetical protein